MKDIPLSTWYYILHPRPCALVCSGRPERYSCMPASWIMPVSRSPPYVAIAIARTRYTYTLIRECRCFTINMLGLGRLKALHYLGTVSGREVPDKVSRAGLTVKRAKRIETIVIDEAVAIAECVLEKDIECGDHNIIVGRIIDVYGEEYMRGPPDLRKYKPILHIGRDLYTTAEKIIKAPSA